MIFKKRVSIIILIILFSVINLSGCDYISLNTNNKLILDDSWTLTFEDNFDTLDLTKWKFNKQQEGLRRAAYYVDDEMTLFVANGKLFIRTKWRQGKYGEGFYTSWLETAINKNSDNNSTDYSGFSQTYGYFEINCKVPSSYGIWSAFWLMPDNNIAFSENDILGTGRDGAEIDIMESPFYYRKGQNSLVQSAVHCDGYKKGILQTDCSKLYHLNDIYNEFHSYAVMWDENEYTFYYDGYEIWRTDHYNGTSRVNQYMILSVEVGGANENGIITSYGGWSGDPLSNDKSQNYDFVIDYVKVYSKS